MSTSKETWDGVDRRITPKRDDLLYRTAVWMNIVLWLLFLAAMVVLHYARPDFIAGVQRFWGIPGREVWQNSLLFWLCFLLVVCVLLSVLLLYLEKLRSRRKQDFFALNIFFVFFFASIGLLWILLEIAGKS